MENRNYINTYGRYDWGRNTDHAYIQPESLFSAKEKLSFGMVFHCIAQDKHYITLQYGNLFFRVKPDLYILVPPLKFNIGDKVMIKGKPADTMGIVLDIIWHFDRAQPMYFLRVNGRKKSRRYYDDELEKIPE